LKDVLVRLPTQKMNQIDELLPHVATSVISQSGFASRLQMPGMLPIS
jgi:hypothetical protein